MAKDPIYRLSLAQTICGMLWAMEHSGASLSDVYGANPDLKAALQIVSQKTGGNAILFLVGRGRTVAGGTAVAQEVSSATIASVLSLGMISYSQHDLSFLDTYAALVDAETGEILWSNSLRLLGGGFTDRYYYSEQWPDTILYHVPFRKEPTADQPVR